MAATDFICNSQRLAPCSTENDGVLAEIEPEGVNFWVNLLCGK